MMHMRDLCVVVLQLLLAADNSSLLSTRWAMDPDVGASHDRLRNHMVCRLVSIQGPPPTNGLQIKSISTHLKHNHANKQYSLWKKRAIHLQPCNHQLQRINLKGNSPTKTISFQHVLLMDLSPLWPSRPVLGHSGITSGFWPRQSLGFKNPKRATAFSTTEACCFSSKKAFLWDPIWSNYSDLTRPHPKWWFSKGNLLFQENLGW